MEREKPLYEFTLKIVHHPLITKHRRDCAALLQSRTDRFLNAKKSAGIF